LGLRKFRQSTFTVLSPTACFHFFRQNVKRILWKCKKNFQRHFAPQKAVEQNCFWTNFS
jgi:hypothetical protein